MKTGFKKRWWHDPDLRHTMLAFAVAMLCLAAVFWNEWKKTDPSRGWSPVKNDSKK